MHHTAQAARRALLQRFLALSGVLAVAVLLFLAATSRTQAYGPEGECPDEYAHEIFTSTSQEGGAGSLR
jgi:hypothetical protein